MNQMFFATSVLHVHLMQWDDVNLVERAVNKCDEVWESVEADKVSPLLLLVLTFLIRNVLNLELHLISFSSFAMNLTIG